MKKIQTVKPVTQKQTHGAMWFKCQECGTRWRMWLEKGVEDPRFRRIYPEQHKTVPESIICQCGGSAEHVDWQKDLKFKNYKPILPHMNYFGMIDGNDFAEPIINRR
ncbi:hypothetical protein [Acetobacterium wieringae]|uniref:Uncharacterized protein n=1 Tax=Acetobacterium wieringae TaxID=52694 RepID=A0A1F2PMA1_9FIRM|nr:hypothetical protein [Acetobacterium wieringae]OFV72085.1 hypothetical protein ACWI_03350 [Acetobacterium wieringae]